PALAAAAGPGLRDARHRSARPAPLLAAGLAAAGAGIAAVAVAALLVRRRRAAGPSRPRRDR
ncbi:hypothetical protein V6U80_22725, partial [Micromonospora sp. CPCC 205543]